MGSSNDCEQDCAGVWGGSATEDSCGTCDSNSSNDCASNETHIEEEDSSLRGGFRLLIAMGAVVTLIGLIVAWYSRRPTGQIDDSKMSNSHSSMPPNGDTREHFAS